MIQYEALGGELTSSCCSHWENLSQVAAGLKWISKLKLTSPQFDESPVAAFEYDDADFSHSTSTCRNYRNSRNDNNNLFQDNLGCSAFTVYNLNSPFARDIKPTEIVSFFLRQCWKSCSRIKHWHIKSPSTMIAGSLVELCFEWSSIMTNEWTTCGGRSLCLTTPDLCLVCSHTSDIHRLFTDVAISLSAVTSYWPNPEVQKITFPQNFVIALNFCILLAASQPCATQLEHRLRREEFYHVARCLTSHHQCLSGPAHTYNLYK